MGNSEIITAFVAAVHRERYELWTGEKTIYGRLKTSDFYHTKEISVFPTVGDRVEVLFCEAGDSLIKKVLPRKSVFFRLNATQGLPDQAIAANFDYVFITMSLNRDFHLSKLERYLNAAYKSGGEPVLLLTKVDLCEDTEPYLRQVRRIAPKLAAFCVSSVTGEGLSALESYLGKDKTIVLSGSSGVGKSSLVNALTGKEKVLTGEIREADAQGRHTTTGRQCILLPEQIVLPDSTVISGGGKIIDTPGMRKLIVSDAAQGQKNSFEDIKDLIRGCRFANCSHTKEPGCAVQSALTDGTLSPKRWRNYRALCEEEAYAKQRRKIISERNRKSRRKLV